MSVLGAILDDKRRAVAARRAEVPLEVLESKAEPSDRSFLDALRAPGLSLIAEIKHRSPSRGVLRAEVAPRAIAAIYDRYAAAISVLTDEPYFGGAPAHLAEARRGSRRPLLCKDFVVDPEYQVPEARAWGADTVLLIARVLSAPQIERGLQIARRLGMEPLVEVHQRRELEQVLGETSARIVGVNSRDLDTLAIDPGRMEELAQAARAAGKVVVAESGLETQEQLGRVRSFADAVLIGSRLMAAPDPGAAIRDLGFPRRAPRVKICGLRDRAAAERCAALGVDRVGFNFVAGSKRQVRPEQAKVIWSGLEGPQPVMVVAGASMEEIAALRRSTGFFAVQLHGDEPPDRCAQLAAEGPVIKALTADHDPASVRRYREAGAEILFDAPKGGGGVPFDWGRLAGRTGADFTLAGGLTAENVAAAIGALDPPAVDVASGVERDGAIDPDRIAAFVAAVRGTAEAP